MRLLTIPQAAERLGCGKSHVYELINHGYLRRFDIGIKARGSRPTIRVADEDIDAYIASAETPIPAA